MKNKKLTYILIPAAILIWVLIFVRIFSFVKSPEGNTNPKSVPHFEQETDDTVETFEIFVDYPDPFLTHVSSSASPVKKVEKKDNTRNDKPQNINKKKIIRWPRVVYRGMIYHNATKKTVGIVTINHSNFLMQPGDTIHQIYMEHATKDSIQIVYKGNRRTVRKEDTQL